MFPENPVPTVANPGSQAVQNNATLSASGFLVLTGFGAGSVTLVINVVNAPTGTTPTLQYTLQEVDPGDDTTLFGSTATSTSITAAGIQTVTLSGVKGGAIKVSWAVGGTTPSFTGVYATLGQGGAAGGSSVDQGTAAALSGAWPVKVTDGTNVLGTGANPVRVDTTGTTTQPVSAASLPLPTGAATAANQTTLGSQTTKLNDGTNTAAVTAASALKVDGSAVTQPVSGTVTANIGTTNGLALDATLTGGTAKAIARGGVKGSTTAADVTSTASGVNHQPLDIAIYDAAGNLLGVSGAPVRTDPTGTTTQPVSSTQLPVALVGGRLDGNVGAWLGSTAPTVGSKTSANSIPVVIASDQGTIAVSGTITANIGTSGSLALDATLTGGTAKSIVRGGAKGATTAADVTSTASGADHQPLDVAIYDASGNLLGVSGAPVRVDPTGTTTQPVSSTQLPAALVGGRLDENVGAWLGSTAPTVGSKTSANSVPVVIASDQGAVAISAASLPLPTGAATAANQTTLGSQTTKLNDGTNTAAVKAASVLAVVSDPALVVSDAAMATDNVAAPTIVKMIGVRDEQNLAQGVSALTENAIPRVLVKDEAVVEMLNRLIETLQDLALLRSLDANGPQHVVEEPPSASRTNLVPASTSSVVLLPMNRGRKGATIWNDSLVTMIMNLDEQPASTSIYSVKVVGGGYYEVPFKYQGTISALWISSPAAADSAHITEFYR